MERKRGRKRKKERKGGEGNREHSAAQTHRLNQSKRNNVNLANMQGKSSQKSIRIMTKTHLYVQININFISKENS